MKLTVKRMGLGLALALTFAAMMAVDDSSPELRVVEPVTKVSHPSAGENLASSAEPEGPARLSELKRSAMEITESNPFVPKSWFVAPPPQPAHDTKPVPPPLPFSYKGKLEEADGHQLFYLAKGDESFVVSVGDTFGGSYKLDSTRADALIIRYLPLSAVQTLRYGPDP